MNHILTVSEVRGHGTCTCDCYSLETLEKRGQKTVRRDVETLLNQLKQMIETNQKNDHQICQKIYTYFNNFVNRK